jgi:putative cell wall-binding protein
MEVKHKTIKEESEEKSS